MVTTINADSALSISLNEGVDTHMQTKSQDFRRSCDAAAQHRLLNLEFLTEKLVFEDTFSESTLVSS